MCDWTCLCLRCTIDVTDGAAPSPASKVSMWHRSKLLCKWFTVIGITAITVLFANHRLAGTPLCSGRGIFENFAGAVGSGIYDEAATLSEKRPVPKAPEEVPALSANSSVDLELPMQAPPATTTTMPTIPPLPDIASILSSVPASLLQDKLAAVEEWTERLEGTFANFSFTSKKSSLEHGFPTKANSHNCAGCLLRRHLSRWLLEGKELRIKIVGGSATAKPCGAEAHELNWFDYKFLPDLREFAARSGAGPVSGLNLAQGNTDSRWNAVLQDSIVDLATTDILLWEYAINDASAVKPPPAHMQQRKGKFNQTPGIAAGLDMWLLRVSRSKVQPPPAIVLLYFWDYQGKFPHSSAFVAQQKVVEWWQGQGLDITVVYVGATLTGPARYALRDTHHVNCDGATHIGHLVQHHLLTQAKKYALQKDPKPESALQLCEDRILRKNGFVPGPAKMKQSASPIGFFLQAAAADAIQTFTLWQPHDRRWEPHRFEEEGNDTWTQELLMGSKSMPGRKDRKIDVTLPDCPEAARFRLPGVHWRAVALGLTGGSHNVAGLVGKVHGHYPALPHSSIEVKINGKTALNNVDGVAACHQPGCSGYDWRKWFNYWRRLSDSASSGDVHLEVCHHPEKNLQCKKANFTGPECKQQMHWLVGFKW
eukprot:TRINITY_DN11745_c0_g1_i1.p1 TRINITY_DN11745_c0_g1~~TRINITY_DN11745_c0_g1_i1.p1  ORF type:complete len:652 (+),score=145.82 TRINITY_DN11745_c0_g1_i1:85-2040(+)